MTHERACGAYRDRLLELAAGRLPPSERDAVERHLVTCAACRRELADWQAIGGALEARDRRVPADARAVAGWGRLSNALADEPPQQPLRAVGVVEPPEEALPTDTGELRVTVLSPDERARGARTWPPFRAARGAGQKRFPGLPAVAAALLVAVLGAAIFGVLGRLRPGVATPTASVAVTATPSGTTVPTAGPTDTVTPSNCSAARTSFVGQPGTYMGELAMVSASEGWASVPQGPLLHFSNCRWAPVNGVSNIGGISMLSATEGWATGSDARKLIYHYTGGQWLQQLTPVGSAADASSVFNVIRMRTSSDGWIVEEGAKDSQGRFTFHALHYDGSRWTSTSLPLAWFFDAAAVGPDEAWLAGSDAGGNLVLLHDVHGTLTTFPSVSGNLRRFQVNAPNDIWLVGWYPAGYDYLESTGAFVLHYDGTSWQQAPLSADPNVQQGKGLFILSASDGWAFPAPRSTTTYTTITGAERLTAAGWQAVAWPFSDVLAVDQLAKVGPDEYWAIGSVFQSTTTSSGSETTEYSVLLHYADGAWSQYGQVG